jgi:hypothetical protein
MKIMDAIELASIINKPSALFLFIWSISPKTITKFFWFQGPWQNYFPSILSS